MEELQKALEEQRIRQKEAWRQEQRLKINIDGGAEHGDGASVG